ncbi:MAG: hypothetical protein ABSA16_16610 [Thermoguttaceae bacterium]|jgi:hypothetical protein
MIHLQNTLPATDILHQLLHMLCRGLPAYVVEINPWMQPAHEPLSKALANLAADRRLFAQRTAQALLERGEYPDPGTFPLEYTGLNDVSIEYLTGEIIDSLQLDIEILPEFSAQLAEIPELHALAEEILGNTIGHAEILEKCRM